MVGGVVFLMRRHLRSEPEASCAVLKRHRSNG